MISTEISPSRPLDEPLPRRRRVPSGLADRGSQESGEYVLPLGEEAWLAALSVSDALETVPGFRRGAAVEVLVKSDMVVPETKGVKFGLAARRLVFPGPEISEPRQGTFFRPGR